MKKLINLPAVIMAFLCLFAFLIMPTGQASATLADGTYNMNYVIQKADNDSVSMANDYFEKPAKLIVKNGKMNVQVQMNHSAWIKEFKAPVNGNYIDSKVVSEDTAADKRTVEFAVDDLSKPFPVKIHVVVPDVDYDHHYTIRFAFDANVTAVDGGQPAAAATKTDDKKVPTASAKEETTKQPNTQSGEKTSNPQTGDEANIALFGGLLLASTLFLVRKVKFSRN